MNRYGQIRFAHVHERVWTKSFVVLIMRNSKLFHLGAQGTFNPRTTRRRTGRRSAECPEHYYRSRLRIIKDSTTKPPPPILVPVLVLVLVLLLLLLGVETTPRSRQPCSVCERRGGPLRGARFASATNGCELVTDKRTCREVSWPSYEVTIHVGPPGRR